jgi:hypothetical protein
MLGTFRALQFIDPKLPIELGFGIWKFRLPGLHIVEFYAKGVGFGGNHMERNIGIKQVRPILETLEGKPKLVSVFGRDWQTVSSSCGVYLTLWNVLRHCSS